MTTIIALLICPNSLQHPDARPGWMVVDIVNVSCDSRIRVEVRDVETGKHYKYNVTSGPVFDHPSIKKHVVATVKAQRSEYICPDFWRNTNGEIYFLKRQSSRLKSEPFDTELGLQGYCLAAETRKESEKVAVKGRKNRSGIFALDAKTQARLYKKAERELKALNDWLKKHPGELPTPPG